MNLEAEEAKLLATIKDRLPELRELWKEFNSHWHYEDQIYRFYHQSYKVFRLQESAKKIVSVLQSLAPNLSLNSWFMQIVTEGTGKEFDVSMNQRWPEETRPMVEAFFHACPSGRCEKLWRPPGRGGERGVGVTWPFSGRRCAEPRPGAGSLIRTPKPRSAFGVPQAPDRR